jgi:hypothetical protein
MFGVKAKITKCIDDTSYPAFVECQFVDAHGKIQIFNDKDAIFAKEMLNRNSLYPIDGVIGCEIVERKRIDGCEIIKVDTELPWGIESVKSETIFEVSAEQITEFEVAESVVKPTFILFQNSMYSREFFLQNLYDAFNRREIETILSMIDENVKWANGMEGGFVHGRDNVREYWQKQFAVINPQLTPLKFRIDEKERNTVDVHQTVYDLQGNVLLKKSVKQIFTIENNLIKVFEISDVSELENGR